MLTKIFVKPLSDSGVTFEGYYNLRIESRKIVKDKLNSYLNYAKISRKPTIRVILGEWGEGKTDAYIRYIEPQTKKMNYLSYSIAASSIANAYDLTKVRKLHDSTSFSSIMLLCSIFACIEEKYLETKYIEQYTNANDYLQKMYELLDDNNNKIKIFVFIDEFEDLLSTQDKLTKILSGIKQTINGQYKFVTDEGKYPGGVHFIVAATPDSYFKIQTFEDFSQWFGGLGRRTGLIPLPEVNKEEGIRFLWDLLVYAYDGKLPDPLPISTIGIFDGIYHITQGNPGNMVSLLTRLLSNSITEDNKFRVIDSDVFLNFMSTETVYVYGGSTPCADSNKIMKYFDVVSEQKNKKLGERCYKILKTLLGQLKPFTISELDISKNQKDAMDAINQINIDLKNSDNISNSIIKLKKFRPEVNWDEFLNQLKDYRIKNELQEDVIIIDRCIKTINELKNDILYYKIHNTELIKEFYIPFEVEDIKNLFEGIDLDRSKELYRIFSRIVDDKNIYYKISNDIIDQIYPTPIPKEFQFIKNRDKRMNLWRNITKNLSDYFDNNILDSILYLLKNTYDITIKDDTPNSFKKDIKILNFEYNNYKFRILFNSKNGDLKTIDVEKISDYYKSINPKIHGMIFIYSGGITDEAFQKIEDKGLGYSGNGKVLTLSFHPTLIKRILGIYRAKLEIKSNELDNNLLNNYMNRIISEEIGFYKLIDNWIELQNENGFIIKNYILNSTSNVRRFSDTMKFYINFIENPSTPDDIWNKNQEIQDFTTYGRGVGLTPDMDIPELKRISEELAKFNFLTKENNEYSVVETNVKKNIVEILKSNTNLSEEDIAKYFIIENQRNLGDVFLPILEHKGIITKKNNRYSLTIFSEVDRSLKLKLHNFELSTNKIDYLKYGYIYFVKKKGYRLISLESYKNFININKDNIEKYVGLNESIALQKIRLLDLLLDNYSSKLEPLFDDSILLIDKILYDIKEKWAEIQSMFEKLQKNSNKWIKVLFKIENIKEYTQLKNIYEYINNVPEFNYEKMQEIIKQYNDDKETKNIFWYDNDPKNAFYFNPKYKEIHDYNNKLLNLKNEIENTCLKINERFSLLDNKNRNIIEENKKYDKKEYILTFKFHEIISKFIKDLTPNVDPMELEITDLKEIQNLINENLTFVMSQLTNLQNGQQRIINTFEYEKELKNILHNNKKLKEQLKWVFDLEDNKTSINIYNKNLELIQEEHMGLLKKINIEETSEITQTVREINSFLDKIEEKYNKNNDFIEKYWEFQLEIQLNRLENIKIIRNKIIEENANKKIDQKISDYETLLKNNKILKDSKYKLSEFKSLYEEIQTDLYDELKTTISINTIKILELIINETKDKAKWMRSKELTDKIINNLSFSQEDIEISLNELKNIDLLEEGLEILI